MQTAARKVCFERKMQRRRQVFRLTKIWKFNSIKMGTFELLQ